MGRRRKYATDEERREAARQSYRKFAEANREAIKTRQAAYQAANRDAINERRAEYRRKKRGGAVKAQQVET